MKKKSKNREIRDEITNFISEEFGELRVERDENGEPWFCLVDVCRALGLTPKTVAIRLDDGVFSKYPILDTLGREQQAIFVNEDGLYDTIFDSRKPVAKTFRKWVTSEVLPSIRKYGAYLTPQTQEMANQDPEYLNQLNQRVQRLENKLEAAEPELEFAMMIKGSEGFFSVGQAAKALTRKGLVIGRNQLYNFLREQGLILVRGIDYNTPSQAMMRAGYLDLDVGYFINVAGNPQAYRRTVITPLGLEFLFKIVK